MRPVIGLSCSWEEGEDNYWLPANYARSIERAGGVPIILPNIGKDFTDELMQICSALVFSGGGDIDPVYWGEAPSPGLGEIDPERDRFELYLARQAYDLRKPTLGICRGCQILNVACGGTLIQDIDSFLSHQQKAPRHHPFHDIVLMEGSLLQQMVGVHSLRVNSFHHQAIKEVGRDLSVCAWTQDGIVEALAGTIHPFWLGVQWHPECMNDDISARLFAFLVQACF